MIAFHYPPFQSGSGVLRSLAFSRDLAAAEWNVSVLTAKLPHEQSSDSRNERLVPDNCKVIRAFALNAAKSLSVFGKYPGFLDVPDRFSSWIVSAFVMGFLHIRKHRPDFIYSTYPIASAHLIGWLLCRWTGIRWIADFRDPMLMEGHPDTEPRIRAHHWIEQKTIANCTAAIFTNRAAKTAYEAKYPAVDSSRFHVIENGFDERIFTLAKQALATKSDPKTPEEIVLVHSGSLYPNHRDPQPFFAALSKLHNANAFANLGFRVVLRGCGYESQFRALIQRCHPELLNLVFFEQNIDYVASVTEILSSDGVLLLQGPTCNAQVPAKLYEYARSGKPILVLTDPFGETARVLDDLGVTERAKISSVDDIAALIKRFLDGYRLRNYQGFVAVGDTERLSRSLRSDELSAILRDTL